MSSVTTKKSHFTKNTPPPTNKQTTQGYSFFSIMRTDIGLILSSYVLTLIQTRTRTLTLTLTLTSEKEKPNFLGPQNGNSQGLGAINVMEREKKLYFPIYLELKHLFQMSKIRIQIKCTVTGGSEVHLHNPLYTMQSKSHSAKSNSPKFTLHSKQLTVKGLASLCNIFVVH